MAKTKPLRTERALLRAKHYLKTNYIGIIALIIIIIGVFFLVKALIPSNPNEITESDIFSNPNFNAKDVSVLEIKLGDTMEQVTVKIGKPKTAPRLYEPNIADLEYGTEIGLDKPGLIIQLQAGIVTRITIKEAFNKLLIGKTKIDKTKDQIYAMFGVPDSTRFVQFSENTGRAYRVMNYKKYNMEVIVLAEKENGFSFYL